MSTLSKIWKVSFWTPHFALLNKDLRLRVHFASLPQQQQVVTAVPCRCALVAHCLFLNPVVLPLHPPAHLERCQSRRRWSGGTSFASTTMSMSNRSDSLPCATPPARRKQGWDMLLFCIVWFCEMFLSLFKKLGTRMLLFFYIPLNVV